MKNIKLVTEMIKKQMNEATMLDSNELKVISKYVNGIGALPALQYVTNDPAIKKFQDQINSIRMEMMEHVATNSNYKFVASGSNGWKLVKK